MAGQHCHSRSARLHCTQDIDLLLLQGIVLRESGEYPEAESCLIAVISGQWPVDSKKAEARHQLALLYAATARSTEAEAQWREVLAECPEHAAARQGLDTLQRQRNGNQEALAEFKRRDPVAIGGLSGGVGLLVVPKAGAIARLCLSPMLTQIVITVSLKLLSLGQPVPSQGGIG